MQKSKKPGFKFRFQELMLIVLVVTSSVILSFNSGGFIINFRNVGFTILSTIEQGAANVTFYVKDFVGGIVHLATISKEYEVLTEKLKDYEYMQRTNAAIRKENSRLKEQLGFSESIQQKNIPANIISRGADNLHTTIIIDKGSKDGIKKNMSVLSIQNGNIGVVGKIVTVGYSTSQVMTVYNTGCTISSRIQNTRDIGLITGNGSPETPLSMKYIKKRVISDLHFGDVIVTSGENGNYLKEIPIGTISKITVLDYDSSLDIEIEPIVDFARLETVIVVSSTELKETKEIINAEEGEN